MWVEGGTPTDPLNANPNVGFGALRCAQDALNGDNVDAVTFPQASTHVFCYYYLVTPPPPPGTITIVKHVLGAQSDTFPFQGNISYNPGGAFTVGAGANYDPSKLAREQGRVVVTMNYRLGALGWLTPELVAYICGRS